MARISALFGGQGSQYPGMGAELFADSAAARGVYECGGDILGFDLAKTSFSGTEEELARTIVCQPVIFAHSLAAFLATGDKFPAPVATAGHSLGEYAALCCAGAYSMEDGFRIIAARAEVMEEAARSVPGTMVAIIGDAEAVKAVCEKYPDVWAVNFNLPTQTVISGAEAPCLAAAEELAAAGFRAARLSVGSAFHTPMMQKAADELKGRVSAIAFKKPALSFYSNLTGGLYDIEDFPAYFALHMISPVRFVEEIAAMTKDGIDTCVEFGPKKTAVTLAKKIDRSLKVFNVENPEDISKTATSLFV